MDVVPFCTVYYIPSETLQESTRLILFLQVASRLNVHTILELPKRYPLKRFPTTLSYKNNDTLIDIFDRMINVGTAKNFTEQELQMFDMIEHVTKSAEDLNLEGHHKCYNTFLR